MLCFRKFPIAQKFIDEKGGREAVKEGVSRFFVGKILSRKAKTFCRGML